jgi:hypothetical protein
MIAFVVVFVVSAALAGGFLLLRAAEIRAERRFAFASVRCSADSRFELWARAAAARAHAVERRLASWLRAAPHRAADLAALMLRLVATRALRMLRWLHERRARGHAPAADASKGAVSFFVSSLGERGANGTSAR